MRSTMGSTIMIWKIVIWYFSAQWNKTEKDSPTERYQVPGRTVRHWKYSATRLRKTLIIWYVPKIIDLSPLRTFVTLTLFTDAIFPTSKVKHSANNPRASNHNT